MGTPGPAAARGTSPGAWGFLGLSAHPSGLPDTRRLSAHHCAALWGPNCASGPCGKSCRERSKVCFQNDSLRPTYYFFWLFSHILPATKRTPGLLGVTVPLLSDFLSSLPNLECDPGMGGGSPQSGTAGVTSVLPSQSLAAMPSSGPLKRSSIPSSSLAQRGVGIPQRRSPGSPVCHRTAVAQVAPQPCNQLPLAHLQEVLTKLGK